MSLSAISKLEAIVEKAEIIAGSIGKINIKDYSKRHGYDLKVLSDKLQKAAVETQRQIRSLERRWAEKIQESCNTFLSKAEKIRASIKEKDKVNNIEAFRKNITIIFKGPKDSTVDQASVTLKKKRTRKRCERIRGLNPDGLISWAVAFPQSDWAAGSMNDEVFDNLIVAIEPEEVQVWPEKMTELLHVFSLEQSLSTTREYQSFLQGISNSSVTSMPPRKRRRIENTIDTQTRKIQYMFSKVPRHLIRTNLGDDLADVMEASNNWNIEESLGETTTQCITALIPEGLNEDISFTIWAGQRRGGLMMEKLQMENLEMEKMR